MCSVRHDYLQTSAGDDPLPSGQQSGGSEKNARVASRQVPLASDCIGVPGVVRERPRGEFRIIQFGRLVEILPVRLTITRGGGGA